MKRCDGTEESPAGGAAAASGRLKDIFDLFGLQQNRSVLTRTVTVGLSHHQNQITVGDRLNHKHPETTSYSQSINQSINQS